MNTDPVLTKEGLILAAARKRFAHFGFSKVTMDEIASDVGMAKPSLYYYFATKEQLFNAVIEQEQRQFAADMEAMLRRHISATQKLKEYVEIRLKLFRELVNLSRLGFVSWMEMKSLSQDLFQNLERQEVKFLLAIIMDGKSSGEFSPSHPHQTAQVFLHVLHGLRLRMFRTPSVSMLDDSSYAELGKEMDLAIDHLIHGIRT